MREFEFEFESDRHFQIWKYGVSHAQLLLRSVKDAAHSTRIDVLFVNVKRLDLPTSLNGLRIERADDHFRLCGSDWQGSVVAGNFAHAEDDGEYHAPSPVAAGSGI